MLCVVAFAQALEFFLEPFEFRFGKVLEVHEVIAGAPGHADQLIELQVQHAGVAVLVVMIMLGRSGENRRPPARIFQGYRGKHLPADRLFFRPKARSR